MKKWVILSFLVLLLISFSPPPQNDIAIDVEAGFGGSGYYRPGDWTPLRVTVSSDTQDINGFLRVRMPGGGDVPAAVYQTPINFDRRAGQSTLFLYAVMPGFLNRVEVELVREDGRIVTTQRANVSQIAARDILYVVLTESRTGTVNATQIPIGRGDSFQANWTVDEVPANGVALQSVDVMILHDVDTGNLSLEQRDALRAWVISGGHMIVMSGPNWQRTTAGLDDLLPVEVSGTATLDSAAALGDFLALPSAALEIETPAARSTARPGTEVLLGDDSLPLIVRDELGGGMVDFVALDPFTEPLASYGGLSRLWFELTADVSPQPSWTDGIVNWPTAQRAVRVASNFDFPSVLELLAFLGIYVVLIGPLNYLALRILRKRELAWVTIPLLVIGFTVIAYFYGFNLRGSNPSVNHLSVIQVWDDAELAEVDSLVGIFSPRRTTYDIELAGQLTLRPLPYIGNDLLVNRTFTDQNLAVTQSDTYRADDIPVDAGIVTAFTANGFVPATPYEGSATWHLNETSERVRVTGSFESDIALKDAVLLVKDNSQYLGDIEAGQLREFDLGVNLQEPAWLTFGNRTDTNQRFQFSGRRGRSMSVVIGGYFGVNCPQPADFGTLIQVLERDLLNCVPYEGFHNEEAQTRLLLLQSVLNDIDFSGGRGLDAYIVGWSDSAPFNVELTDHNEEFDHQSLYIFKLHGQITSTSDMIFIPPGMMTWTVAGRTEQNTRRDLSPYSISLSPTEQSVLRFVPFGELQQAEINRLHVDLSMSGPSNSLDIALFNWETGEWDPVSLTAQTTIEIEGETVADYVGPSNAVEVQVVSTQSANFATITKLEVTMFGQLD